MHHGIQVLKELNRIEIFIAAVFIRYPLTLLLAVVQIEHGRHCVNSDAVDMVLSDPVENVRNQEIPDLILRIIKYLRAPVRMLADSRIGMLKDTLSVKTPKPVRVSRKMRRNPVKDNTYFILMQLVDQIHKIGRITMSGSGCVITCHLIPPGTVERIFRNTHKLYMRVVHLLQIIYDSVRKLTVIIESLLRAVGMFHPRTDVALIDCHGLLIIILAVPCRHPCAVRPFELTDIKSFGRISRTHLRIIGKGICLIKLFARWCADQILVKLIFAHIRDKKLIDTAGTQFLHRVFFFIPAVKGSYHMNACRVGRPYCEKHTLHAVFHGRVCPQLFINVIVRSLREHILVSLGDKYLLHRLLLCFLGNRLFLFPLLFLHSRRLSRFLYCHNLTPCFLLHERLE